MLGGPNICVVGSINMDLTVISDRMPSQGETLLGRKFSTYPGGKGANQAVAAARLGAKVHLIGAVGNDAFGEELLSHLSSENIDLEGVATLQETSTGVAMIILSNQDNRIIVIPGANAQVSPKMIEHHRKRIEQSDMVLLQLEIPLETVQTTVEIASKRNIPIILNPAPYQDLPFEIVEGSTYLTPNEIEAGALLKSPFLQNATLEKLIITKGEKGVRFFECGIEKLLPAYSINVVDTTGAGDTFNGAFVTELGKGTSLSETIRFANAAAALSITKIGAQGGMPSREAVEKLLER